MAEEDKMKHGLSWNVGATAPGECRCGYKSWSEKDILEHVKREEGKNEMSPNDLEILIHCYCHPEPHPRINAQAVQETLTRFLEDGIIKGLGPNSDLFVTTHKGAAWLQAILKTPYPRQVWVDVNNNIIYEGCEL